MEEFFFSTPFFMPLNKRFQPLNQIPFTVTLYLIILVLNTV